MFVKKVACALNHTQLRRCMRGNFCHEFSQTLNIAVFVAITLDEEDWLATLLEKTEVVLIDWRAYADQLGNTLIRRANFQSDAGAEGKTTKRDLTSWIIRHQVIQSGAHVFALTATFIMFAGALAHTAKIDSQRGQSGIVQRRRSAKHDLVVHRAAPERVRVQHQRDAANGVAVWLFQNCFQTPVRRGNKKVSCRIHLGISDLRLSIADLLVVNGRNHLMAAT